jgi:hypothetical protein
MKLEAVKYVGWYIGTDQARWCTPENVQVVFTPPGVVVEAAIHSVFGQATPSLGR